MDEKTKAALHEKTMEFFRDICSVPHGSFDEKRLSGRICEWARGRGLKAVQDAHNNAAVYKPGSAGCEGLPPVIIQAHIDMVCEKAPGYEHDFKKDAIPYQIDGDIMSTGGKTTLGADDGIGAAMILALLDSDGIKHPPIEAAFTTAEEEDLSGALNIDGGLFKGRKMINIDHGVDSEIVLGSAGGTGAEITFTVAREAAPQGAEFMDIVLTGLPGGHSGENIDSGNGNAIVLMARLLWALPSSARICAFRGGTFRTALPREASVQICFAKEDAPAFGAAVKEAEAGFRAEYAACAPELRVSAEPALSPEQPLTAESTRRIIAAVILSPNGIAEMSNKMPGVVESSDNLGELHLDAGECRIVYEIRAALPSEQAYTETRIKTLAALLGAEYKSYFAYPSWSYDPASALKRLSNEVYKEEFGAEQKNVVLHAGLECGCFFAAIPGLDAVSVGPNMWNLHSPSEHLSVSSARKTVSFIAALLEKLAE